MNIELTEKDAELFKTFRQNQDAIEVMVAAGVFDMRRGSIEVHFDLEGKIGAIVGHPVMYKRDQMLFVSK